MKTSAGASDIEKDSEAHTQDPQKPRGLDVVSRPSAECVSDLTSPPYSSFSPAQKWLIISLSTFAASFSPLSSFIFFPAIPTLADALHVSTGRINLTVTSYLIVAGIAPALLGDMADSIGRRMIYLLMMTIYCLANVGLALQSSWTALFVLRMMQSAGSASTIAVGYGVVSDIATPADRGHFVSGMVMGPNIATAIGPILGGALAEYAGWRWIFWLLSILSGTCLLSIFLLLPETARSVVGNGSGHVPTLYQAPIVWLLKRKVSNSGQALVEDGPGRQSHADQRKFRVPNPLTSLNLLATVDCFLIVMIFAIFYMNLSCVQASTSTLFVELYGISELEAGLIYLPAGVGSIVGVYAAGYILGHDYRTTAKKHGITIDKRRGDDMSTFPIEEARLRSVVFTISAAALSTIGYGWALQYKTHMSVPLILQFVIGFSTAIVFNTSGTLLTDVHPKSPSTASAANSIVRCLLAGGGLAAVQPLIDSIGIQWTFTLFGLICLGCLGIVWIERRFGRQWRDAMHAKGIVR